MFRSEESSKNPPANLEQEYYFPVKLDLVQKIPTGTNAKVRGFQVVSVTNKRMLSLVGHSAVNGASPVSSFAKLS